MRKIIIDPIYCQKIFLGRVGENSATEIVFNLNTLFAEFGDGVIGILHQRNGDEQPYPVPVTRDGSAVVWVVGSADVAKYGEGRAELVLTVNDKIAKSAIFTTYTAEALGTVTNPPEPWESWVEEVLDAGARAEQAAENAEEYASEIKDLTVSAHSLPDGSEPTVTKTGGDGVPYNLDFGIHSGADGADGITPTIGANGNWYLGSTDTGKPSRGEQGAQGIQGIQGVPGQDGADGQDGAPGADGEDGYSPAVTVTEITGGHRVTITDKTHQSGQSFDVLDGEDGADGQDGAPGADGEDGITPTIGANGNWYLGSTDTGKPSRGEQGAQGATGQDGADGVSPTITSTSITGGHRLTITDVDGTRTVDVLDGEDGADGTDGADGKSIYAGSVVPTTDGYNIGDLFVLLTNGQVYVLDDEPILRWRYTGYTIKGAPGADGKSAYEAAQDGGYTGTEAQFNSDLADVSDKQDTISDLATIRSGAAAGATAVQPETGKGLFSGNYNDLTNKPTIPTVPTNVSAFTNDAGYLTSHQSLAAYRTASAQDTIDNNQNAAINGKEAKGKITVAGFERTIVSHTVTIVTDGVTTTFDLVGWTGGPA